MKVLKRKIGSDVTVVLNDDIHFRANVSEEEWKQIKEHCEALEAGLYTTTAMSDLMDILDPIAKAERLEKEAKALREAEANRQKEYENAKRLKKAVRIADISSMFEYDEDGLCYLKGFRLPMPAILVESLLNAKYNPNSPFTVDSLMNFWRWCLLNPNPEARTDLFKWFSTGKFSITSLGMIIAYRYVDIKHEGTNPELIDFVTTNFLKLKRQKKGPGNYVVVLDSGTSEDDGTYKLCKEGTTGHWETVGNLVDLYNSITSTTNGQTTIFTDHHTRTMEIVIGKPVSIPRSECDENRNARCSSGLHFMSRNYGKYGEVPMLILINPMNVVAFPSYDHTKGRCCEYLPVGIAEMDEKDNKVLEYAAGTYDYDYVTYSEKLLDDLFSNHTLAELQESGTVSSELTGDDIAIIGRDIRAIIKNRIVKV